MKKSSILCFVNILLIVFLVSCEKDYEYKFIDQDLTGKVFGLDWTYQSGEAKTFAGDTAKFIINLWDENIDPCTSADGSDYTVFFTVPKSIRLFHLQVAILEDTGQTIAFYHDGTIFEAFEGVIEILSIDLTNTLTITGRIDAKFDDSNRLNGNFTVKYCSL